MGNEDGPWAFKNGRRLEQRAMDHTTQVGIAIHLSRAQALVLFEWLVTQTANGEMSAVPFEHDAERDVLWAAEAQLEKALAFDIFAPDYNDRVEAARAAVAGESS
jgi:hypothetical protein